MPKSEKLHLIEKSKETAMLAVQTYNNPLIQFKSESFIVLFTIAWTYLLHSYYRSQGIEYRVYNHRNIKRRFERNKDGSFKYLTLNQCVEHKDSPIDQDTKNNLKFLIGLRNQISHQNSRRLDSAFLGQYQACALNFNHYLVAFHGTKYSMDDYLTLNISFYKDEAGKENRDIRRNMSKPIIKYIDGFESLLSKEERESPKFDFRLFFDRVVVNKRHKADKVIKFVSPGSEEAKSGKVDLIVKEEKEKKNFLPSQIIKIVVGKGHAGFTMYNHIQLWKKHDAKNPKKGYGVLVVKQWYWYQNWVDFVLKELNKEEGRQGKLLNRMK